MAAPWVEMIDTTREPAALDHGASRSADGRSPYLAPEIHVLGALAQLTAGGTDGPDDGFGGAGGSGTI